MKGCISEAQRNSLLFLLKGTGSRSGKAQEGMGVRPKPPMANAFLPSGRVWALECVHGLGENVSKGIREKLAKQMKKKKKLKGPCVVSSMFLLISDG